MINEKNRKVFVSLFIIVIILVNFVVFSPSFFHVARADQITYLIETANIDHLSDLAGYSFSYPRHRLIGVGDQILFRPILFLFVALEKWLFGLNFTYWQITGFLLHLCILWRLQRIFSVLSPSWISFLFILNFSVCYLSQEMVIWHGINGYLLFLIFFLEGFYQFVLYILRDQKEWHRLLAMVGYFTLSCFTYEFGAIASVLFVIFFLINKKNTLLPIIYKRKQITLRVNNAVLLSIPPLVYFYISIVDYFASVKTSSALISMGGNVSFLKIIENFGQTFMWAASFGFLPYFFEINYFIPRLFLVPQQRNEFFNFSTWGVGYSMNVALFLLTLLLLVFSLFIFIRKRRRGEKAVEGDNARQKILISSGIMASLLFLAYLIIITLRASVHPAGAYQQISLYNFYITGLLLTIGLYCVFAVYYRRLTDCGKLFKILIITIFCISISLNAVRSYQTNLAMKNLYSPWRIYVQRLAKFVKIHKDEGDFSYFLVWRQCDNFIVLDIGNQKTQLKGFVSDLLFSRYVKADNPKYYLVYFDKEGILSFEDKKAAYSYINSKSEKEKKQEILFW